MMPIVGGQATPWSRMLRASQVGQHLPDAFQSQVNNAWHGCERSTSDNPRCQFNSRHGHTESCRECRTTPEPKFNPPWPHPTCQCKHAWPRRDLEQRDAHLPADNLRHARAARRTRPDNNFLTYDTSRGGNSRHGCRAVWTTIPDANY